MVCFQTKNPNLGKFWRSLDWKNVDIFYGNLEYFTDIWYNLQPFGMVCGHLVHFSEKNLATLVHAFTVTENILKTF
jgi:hypothetical protein